MQLVIHTGLVTRVQQQKDDSPTDQEEAEPTLHRESASRTCRKFRSLFNSASSRKPSCSFCQAATPSRLSVKNRLDEVKFRCFPVKRTLLRQEFSSRRSGCELTVYLSFSP